MKLDFFLGREQQTAFRSCVFTFLAQPTRGIIIIIIRKCLMISLSMIVILSRKWERGLAKLKILWYPCKFSPIRITFSNESMFCTGDDFYHEPKDECL